MRVSAAATPKRYIECLEECPGFERRRRILQQHEVPPVAACVTVREIPANKEPPPGLIVIAVIVRLRSQWPRSRCAIPPARSARNSRSRRPSDRRAGQLAKGYGLLGRTA